MRKKLLALFIMITCITQSSFCWEKIGSASTDPGYSRLVFPLFSLGQCVIGKNNFYSGVSLLAPYWYQNHDLFVTPGAIYGISDPVTVQLYLPVSIDSYAPEDKKSIGLGNIIGGFEWAYYVKKNNGSYTQATIFNQYKIPVSSKIPALTSGAVDVLIGGTIAHNSPSFYTFASTALLIPTWHNNMRKGYNFFYEFGIGPIITKKPGTLFSIFMEIDGIFSTSDINNPYPCDNTLENNVIWIGPVGYWSFKNFIAQFGVQAPLTQEFKQISDKRNVRIGASLYFKF
jgi:hypothetical protein